MRGGNAEQQTGGGSAYKTRTFDREDRRGQRRFSPKNPRNNFQDRRSNDFDAGQIAKHSYQQKVTDALLHLQNYGRALGYKVDGMDLKAFDVMTRKKEIRRARQQRRAGVRC